MDTFILPTMTARELGVLLGWYAEIEADNKKY